MFDKDTYIRRRRELKKLVGDGVIVLFGNNNSPANFPNNGYHPFRQDSSFLYYFGQQREGLVGVIDVDNDVETLVGDDISIDDIVWYGSVDSVSDMAGQVGVAHSAPMSELENICKDAQAKKRTIHFLPPYRHDIMIQIYDLLGIHPKQQTEKASMKLIKAVVKMRSTKEPQEIEELERAAVIGYKMHTTAMRMVKPGVTEQLIAGTIDGIANGYGSMVSFPTIFSQHAEIMHGSPSMNLLEDGRLVLCDAGAETVNHYCSDNTRTMPVNGKFTQRQLEIYTIVEECHDLALSLSKPGVRYWDVHFAVCRHMTDRLKELGSNSLAPTACVWDAASKKASLSPMSRVSISFLPSSTTGRPKATARSSSTSTSWRLTRISEAYASRTIFSSQRTVAASSARNVFLIIPRMSKSS